MKLAINKWAEEDRPREKLEALGPAALSDSELLAILIGSGNAEDSAVDLMRKILDHCNNNLNSLGKMSIAELCHFKGIGPAKAITILAACELGKRRQASGIEERPEMSDASKVYEYMHPRMQDLDTEEGWALFLNQKCRLIKAVRLSHGGISGTLIDVRIVMKEAVLCNATVMILCHNHPSNNMRPSRDDERLTDRMKKACDIMAINFLDHVIIGDGSYYSFREEGKL
ncbi:MAG: DNA repair protein RadC [Bacteroidaceae bacterium]|nr:DNA repair protein RadC [Bacteroidaceae bacterium]